MSKKLSILLPLLLTACNNSEDNEISDINSVNDIIGVFDLTTQEGTEVDEAYAYIDEDGFLTLYDYLGDSFNNNVNCYLPVLIASFTHKKNNMFFFEDFTGELPDTDVSFNYKDQTLAMNQTTSNHVIELPLTNINITDLEPLCSLALDLIDDNETLDSSSNKFKSQL